MKRVLIIVLVGAFFLGCCTMQRRELVKSGLESIISIKTFSLKTGLIYGTGVVIDKDNGLILTNKHIAPIGSINTVKTKSGESIATIIFNHKELDISVIKVNDLKIMKSTQEMEFASDPEVGDTVYVLGNPLGFRNAVTKGIISNKQEDIIIIDALVNPGNSGGVAVDVNCRIAGLVFAMDMRRFDVVYSKSGFGYAINGRSVYNILKKEKIL